MIDQSHKGTEEARQWKPQVTCGRGCTEDRYCGDCALDKERFTLRRAEETAPTALCLSGGGIRSAAFCFGVVQVLAKRTFLAEFDYLSTVSGGGFIGAWLTRGLAALSDRSDEMQDKSSQARTPDYEKSASENGCGPWSGSAATPDDKRLSAFFNEVADPGSDRVARLRQFTNYLTPSPGLASPDTWTGVLLWIRNTIVNWTVFLPLSVAVAASAVAWFALVCGLATSEPGTTIVCDVSTAAGLICFATMLVATLVQAPSHSHPDRDWREARPEWFGVRTGRIRSTIVMPAVAWCLLCTVVAASLANVATGDVGSVLLPVPADVRSSEPGRHDLARTLNHDRSTRLTRAVVSLSGLPEGSIRAYASLPLLAGIVSLVAYGIAWTWVVDCYDYGRPSPAEPTPGRPPPDEPKPAEPSLEVFLRQFGRRVRSDGESASNRKKHNKTFRRNLLPWLVGSMVSSTLLFLGLIEAQGRGVMLLAFAGPLWVALTEVVRSTCYIALRRATLRGELDREWLARVNATKLVAVATAAAVGSAAVVLPAIFRAPSLAAGLVATGPLAALLGKSARTSLDAAKIVAGVRGHLGTALTAASLVFAASLLGICGDLVVRGTWAARRFAPSALSGEELFFAAGVALLTVAVAIGAAMALGSLIDLDKFSMHAVYRNRLVRAFLGTARPAGDARPDLYTEFDVHDDIRVSGAYHKDRSPKLFPVINMTVNATTGTDTARAERKAASFTVTPLSSGWFQPDRHAPVDRAQKRVVTKATSGSSQPGRDAPRRSYVNTKDFDGRERRSGPGDDKEGIMLGRAVALSGAAVSPNMGYHSSPLVAFVMTLFNVRLGAWLPNPACELKLEEMRDGGTANEAWLLVKELLGRSDLDSKYVYLSDGGHFDNLGLYEMLRRKCRLVLVVDAAQDRAYGFEDLGRTLTKAFIDLGVRVDLERVVDVGNRDAPVKAELAKITYPAEKGKTEPDDAKSRSGSEGYLLYLKPWLPDGVPLEIKAYKMRRESFPHENTINQFFTESDFESYRRLGEHLAEEVLRVADARISSAGGEITGLEGLVRVLASMTNEATPAKAVR